MCSLLWAKKAQLHQRTLQYQILSWHLALRFQEAARPNSTLRPRELTEDYVSADSVTLRWREILGLAPFRNYLLKGSFVYLDGLSPKLRYLSNLLGRQLLYLFTLDQHHRLD